MSKISVRSRNFINTSLILHSVYFKNHGAKYIKVYPGEKYNKFTVLEDLGIFIKDGTKNPIHYVLCLCECGKTDIVALNGLRTGGVKSCGCYHSEELSLRNTKHGMSKTRLYSIWCDIKDRCENKNKDCYKNYGGRGIQICDEWKADFMNFYNWAMDNGYNDKLTIERINVDGNYCPENCKWATMLEQANNKTNTFYLTYKNETKPLRYWSDKTGIPPRTLYRRYRLGWKVEDIIEKPLGSRFKKGERI